MISDKVTSNSVVLKRPRALLFDWDNTLVDTWEVIHRALVVTFEAMGQKPWTLEEARQRVRASARDSFPRLFGDRADEAIEIFYTSIRQHHLEMLRTRPLAEELLRQAAAYPDVILSVVSNKNGDLLREEAEFLRWQTYFYKLIGAMDAPKDKPDPSAVELALLGSGIAPGPEVWFVGDTDIDMVTAYKSGCPAVLIRETPPVGDEFGACPPHLYFSDCRTFGDHLREIFAPGTG